MQPPDPSSGSISSPSEDTYEDITPEDYIPDPGSLADIAEEEADSDQCASADAGAPSSLSPEGNLPPPDPDPPVEPQIWELQIAQQFVDLLKEVSIKDLKLDPDVLRRLRRPPRTPIADEIDDVLRFSLDVYLATQQASQQTYSDVCAAINTHTPTKLLSLHEITRRLCELTGVVSVREDMCPNSCAAFTGPFSTLQNCPYCSSPRYDQDKLAATQGKQKIARQFDTFILGPQLQALKRSPDSSKATRYLFNRMQEVLEEIHAKDGLVDEFDDFCHGEDIRDRFASGEIGEHDFVLMLSVDGAQLYESKQ